MASCHGDCCGLDSADCSHGRDTRQPANRTSRYTRKGNPEPGPKNGFPPSPGLQIAKIKANDNAAFKRKSGGT